LQDTVRLTEFYVPVNSTGGTGTNASQVVGVQLGGAIPAYTSAIGPALIGPGANGGTGLSAQGAAEPAILLSVSESLFLQAEAAHRGIIPGGEAAAATFYNNGITASFEQVSAYGNPLAAPDASANAYYSQPSVAYATANGGNVIKSIITQKYISLNGFGCVEAWNEYRRTLYPNIPASVDGAREGSGELPSRLLYPQVEYDTNGPNVTASALAPPSIPGEFTPSYIFWATPKP
jgi:hypothetical protein